MLKKVFTLSCLKKIPIQEYKYSTEENEYQHLYKKDIELKFDNITDKKECIFENDNDFINCKIIRDRDST